MGRRHQDAGWSPVQHARTIPTRRRAACPDLDDAAVRPVTSTGWTVDQTSHRLVCDFLRGILHQATQVGPGAVDGVGSTLYQVSAVLYTLLLDHPIDRRGYCRSCRRSGAVIGFRRRPCRIHLRASYWLLRQPDNAMPLCPLADEPGPDTTHSGGTGVRPDGPQSRRVPPPDGQPSSPDSPLVITGGMPWPR
ncbi:MAG: hypothetical protein ACRDS1_00590 [Pseudonocardiaceae bacterium]